MFILSFSIGYQFIFILHFVGFASGIFLNLCALIYAIVKLSKDLPYKYWKDQNSAANSTVLVLSTIFSFKLLKMITSGFYKRNWTLAAFEQKF